jgi:hypothetical protein
MVFELPKQPEVEQGQVLYKVQSHATKKALESQAIVQLTNFGPTYIAEKSPLRANVDESCIQVRTRLNWCFMGKNCNRFFSSYRILSHQDFFDSIDLGDQVKRMHVTNKNKKSSAFVSFADEDVANDAIDRHNRTRARLTGRFYRVKAALVPGTFGESFIFCM